MTASTGAMTAQTSSLAGIVHLFVHSHLYKLYNMDSIFFRFKFTNCLNADYFYHSYVIAGFKSVSERP